MDSQRLRRSRTLAIVAFLLLGTAILLPWWTVTYDSGGTEYGEAVRLFTDHRPYATWWGPIASGVLAVAALGLLFVRIAAGSHVHEPLVWRRDLSASLGLAVFAVLGTILWPLDIPNFWGGRSYVLDGGLEVTETAMPGLGLWLAAAAIAVLVPAVVLARRATAEASSQTPK